MPPYKIQISDIRNYTHVALLVDRPSFIESVESISHIFNTGKTDYSDWNEWIKLGEITEDERDEFEIWYYEHTQNSLRETTLRVLEYLKIATEIILVREKIPYIFRPVVRAILIHGTVEEQDYPSVFIAPYKQTGIKYEELYNGMEFAVEDIDSPNINVKEWYVGIFASPWATKKQIAEAIDAKFEETAKKCRNSHPSLKLIGEFLDTKQDIKAIREWYWARQGGSTYSTIASDFSTEKRVLDEEIVGKAVRKYTKMLNHTFSTS